MNDNLNLSSFKIKSILVITILLSIFSTSNENCPRYSCSINIENNNLNLVDVNKFNQVLEYLDDEDSIEDITYNPILNNINCGVEKSSDNNPEHKIKILNPSICHELNLKLNKEKTKPQALFYKDAYFECDEFSMKCTKRFSNKVYKAFIQNESNFVKDNLNLDEKIGNKVLPGEVCNFAKDCYQRFICLNDKCLGKTEQHMCQSHLDCNNGLFCSENKYCKQQMLIGEIGCKNDFECVNNSGCHKGVCTAYYSISNDSTTEVDSPIFCKSGYSDFKICRTGNILKSHRLNESCNSSSDFRILNPCEYQTWNGTKIKGACKCGFNDNSLGFCELDKGDPEYLEYIKTRKELLYRSAEYNCHTMSRIDFRKCGKVKNLYFEMQKKFFIYYNHHLVQKNSMCIKNTILADFYNHDMLLNEGYSKISVFSILMVVILFLQ